MNCLEGMLQCCLVYNHPKQSAAQCIRSASFSQVIDEQVEREASPCDTLDRGVMDTHAEV